MTCVLASCIELGKKQHVAGVALAGHDTMSFMWPTHSEACRCRKSKQFLWKCSA